MIRAGYNSSAVKDYEQYKQTDRLLRLLLLTCAGLIYAVYSSRAGKGPLRLLSLMKMAFKEIQPGMRWTLKLNAPCRAHI